MQMGETGSPTAERPDTPLGGSATGSSPAEHDLTERHFALQDERPGHLADIGVAAMDPYLRGLLFTDGTVTRTLEVQALSPVSVEVLAQVVSSADEGIANYLEVASGTEAIQRRVAIAIDSSPAPAIWAESYIVPSRLPEGFLRALDGSAEGIGESLQQVKLESWREMLWFGLDSSPSWGAPRSNERCVVLQRLYRVITRGRPAMLICESFAIERRSGVYHLAG
jgi:chorismate-pyruvate lyase